CRMAPLFRKKSFSERICRKIGQRTAAQNARTRSGDGRLMMRRMLFGLLVGASLAAPALAQTSVTTDAGTVAGTANEQVISFKGIPYAAPPVGPLRWKAPERAATWNGVREAKAYGNACPQPVRTEAWAQVGAQSEDCLFLNVWRPKKAGKYPVMVFLHGGGFVFGAAGVPLYEGSGLARRGAVVVTINYRLGRLGYF